jgi:hypothetical protein
MALLLGLMTGASGCKLFKKDCHCPSFGQTPTKSGRTAAQIPQNKPC